ncbi:MAG: MFS transporter [Myxococcales bacterium]|nr:MFS transporter [Myxococcales bacterium]
MADTDTALGPSQEKLPPPPPAYRWLVLVVISLAMFGNYYVYDSLNPLEDLLLKVLGVGADQYGRLFSIYSLPNLAMLIVSGVFIDRVGARKATLIFAAICAVGAALTAAGAWTGYGTMLVGRFFFGIGAESLIVAVTAAIARWFKGKELSFAFGINLTIARLGSFAADWSPTWAKPAFDSLQGPLLIAVAFASVSIVAAIAYWVMESQGLKRYDLGMVGATDKIEFKSVFSFGKTYWFVVAICATFYSAIFPFRSFAPKFFQQTHGLSLDDASALNSSLIIGAMIFTPLFGLLVDKVGRRATLMVIGTLLLLPNYFLLTNAALPAWAPMILMGLSFALVPAVMWPSVAYLAPEKNLGTALGIMTMIQQVGMMAVPAIVGYANTASTVNGATDYTPMMAIFTGLVAVGFVFSLLLLKAERGPAARGLETIRSTSSAQPDVAKAA